MTQVRLNRLVIGQNGNAYYAGVYDKSELPAHIVANPELVSAIADKTNTTYANSLVKKEIKVGESEPNSTQQASFFAKDPVVLKEKEAEAEAEAKEKSVVTISVNQATVDDLADIDGITVTTAQKVIEQRETEKLKDWDDLDTRVPLPNKRKWENNFSDRITFD